MNILFLENSDSFSWNVIETLPVPRSNVAIVGPDARDSLPGLLPEVDAVVVGPGPLDPVRAGLVAAVDLIIDAAKPLLGICLGHQAIGLHFGAHLVATEPCHGHRSRVVFEHPRSLPGVTGEHEVMRYHSLSLHRVVAPLLVVARTDDDLVMAVEHDSLPIAGLQFHPDSFGSPTGRRIVECFFEGLA